MAQKCVHQGCGKLFATEDEECVYHPGPPIFHEGQKGNLRPCASPVRTASKANRLSEKGWKCCKPRVLTFDEFLTIPPCTTGHHSTTEHPAKLEKKEHDPSLTPSASPSADLPPAPSRAPVTAPSAPATPPPAAESEDDDPALAIPDGKTCRRKACGAQYKAGQARDDEKCVHHPGAPIFHEGSKGYTCCKRRVLEFDEFMKIEGCKTKERHLFVGSGGKKGKNGAGGEEIVDSVRYDSLSLNMTWHRGRHANS